MSKLLPISDQTKAKWLPFFFIPNLIGYFRISLLFVTIFNATTSPIVAFISQLVGGNLDGLDGYCARRFNQESRLGQVLDYAIDRASTVVTFMILAVLYPSHWAFFCLMLALEIFSHICQVYSTVFSSEQSHKLVGHKQSFLLRQYYTNRWVLCFACASHDLWLGLIYLYYFFPHATLLYLTFICLPGFILKTLVHLIQIFSVFRFVTQEGQG